MRTSGDIRSVPLDQRTAFNLLFLLQQYFPQNELIRERKDVVRRRIATDLGRQGPGRLVEARRVSGLSLDAFERDYVQPGIPVILDRAAADWRCTKEWSLESFSRRFGASRIQIVERRGVSEDSVVGAKQYTQERVFGDFLNDVLEGRRAYMRFSPLLERFPDLMTEFMEDYMKDLGRTALGVHFLMFIGGAGTTTPLHNDFSPFLFVNVSGIKRWTLVPNTFLAVLNPGQSDSLGYNYTEADLDAVDTDRFPGLGNIDRIEALLHPGDVLFVPAWTWHAIKNESQTIGVRCGLVRFTPLVSPSLTLSFIRFFAVRDPSIFNVLYHLVFKKYLPEERWLLTPRIFWRFGRGGPAGARKEGGTSARISA